MSPQHLRLDPVQETLLLTLYARALDSKAPTPILGDTLAAAVADRIAEDTGYDFAKLKPKPSLVASTALRARRIDDVIRRFTTAHPDAVVVDLGCGLDTRSTRCAPPAGVDWYDVDFPEVADLRRRYLPDRSHLVAADVTEPDWSRALPDDRPAVVVAEGLLPFLPGDSFRTAIRRLTTRLPAGELVLNGYTRFAAWAMKYHPSIKALGIDAAQGFDDPREPEHWNAGLTLVAEQLLTRAPEVAAFPQPVRALTRLIAHSTALSRQGTRILHYRF
ncbi:class I SAM-dependent methyltransferase [Saccharothrix syringae]|uniref:Class I SAM-dependent methyltransferase n=1 Tax=Saccharothrix syringae TaxID=103733 RepID=A0A5Q0H2C6_SACSY|nr:class I SAM-dependent methyltransferase [Saccharothrix syringae]QFZ20024.1 class I SAM-dependent methyltransferase [Saccharothrix syringae]